MTDAAAVAGVTITALVCVGSIGGLVTLVVLLVHYGRKRRQQRIDANHAWAGHHGFHYWTSEPSALELSAHAPFTSGHARVALDVFRGTHRGRHLHFFQLQYRTGNGEDESTHDHQVVAVSLPASRPYLEVTHETARSRRRARDLQFENRAFNDLYFIESASPRFAHDVIHPRTMEWMLADPRARVNRWRFEGAWLLTFRSGPLRLEEVFAHADFLHQILDQVPDHVWSEP
ncbi:hypothetical protein [Glycomyces paridis]|uniref:DUF3137 domain-containing protein n=1 Tax=Glycomyces paridis TaxID=2126555 RepID=A0A4S8PJR2_9ACTN|nr:hypothetical protein [Glycomyces paridis]THV28679.1 hypothetical protein E9998_11230 [Glycomyces paridis]